MERYRYRAYVLNKDNSIHLGIDLYCADDGAACERARQLLDRHDIELWQGQRKVARLAAKHHQNHATRVNAKKTKANDPCG
jgi:hypothetical protein